MVVTRKTIKPTAAQIQKLVAVTLAEDVGSGDLTAALIDAKTAAKARLICRESAVLCGVDWVNEVFRQVDENISVKWHGADGDALLANQTVFEAFGSARSLLTAERSAINLLQTLSGTASVANRYARALIGFDTQLLDTRKTLPGLRLEQKYAVKIGGVNNHRVGLFDGVLIKENHILAAGSLSNAVKQARANKLAANKLAADGQEDGLLEVEVKTLKELHEAIHAGVKRILLDNFTTQQLTAAVKQNKDAQPNSRALLEASGNVTLDSLKSIAATGVDFISIGALTKHLTAVDFSLQFKIQ